MASHPEHPLATSDVLAAADRLISAFAATDTDGYFACFAPEATFLFHTEPALLPDRAAYERLWRGWVADGWRVVSCESRDRHVVIAGDTAAFSHTVLTTTETAGEATSTVERESIVFARVDGELVAVHEHLSEAAS